MEKSDNRTEIPNNQINHKLNHIIINNNVKKCLFLARFK